MTHATESLPRHARRILLSLGAALVLWNTVLLSFGVMQTHLVQIGAPARPPALPQPSLRGASSESVAALVRINHELVRELKSRPPASHSGARDAKWSNGTGGGTARPLATAVSLAPTPVHVPPLLEAPSANWSARANASALASPPSSLLGRVLPQRVLPALQASNASVLAPAVNLVDASATGPAYAEAPAAHGAAQASWPGWAAPAATAPSGVIPRRAELPALQAPGLLPPLLAPAAVVGAPPLAAAATWTPGGGAAPTLGAPASGAFPLASTPPALGSTTGASQRRTKRKRSGRARGRRGAAG